MSIIQDDKGLTSEDINRFGRLLFGVGEDEVYYPESSDAIEAIYEELVKELRAALRERDARIAALEAALARAQGVDREG